MISYNQVFLSGVAIFYKVAKNTELAKTKSLFQGLGSCKLLVTFWSTNQYITLFLCVFLFKYTSFTMYWSINIEFIVNSTITHAWMKVIKHTYFLHKTLQSSLLRNTRQYFRSTLDGVILNSKISQTKAQKCKNKECSTKYITQKTLIYHMSDEIKRKGITLFDLNWECTP